MKKLTKIQKLFTQSYPLSNNLINLLFKLKVINLSISIRSKALITSRISDWIDHDRYRKAQEDCRAETRNYDTKPPRSIKPTRTRF